MPRSLAVLLSVSVATGCAHAPHYKTPEIPVSARFLGQEAVERREAQTKADLQAWWAAFDDAALTRFVSLALAQNLDIGKRRHVSPNRVPHCVTPVRHCFHRPM